LNALTEKALEVAATYVGIRETKRNRGPEVDAFLFDVGLDPTKGSYPWCAAFVYAVFKRASAALVVPNPVPRTAGVLKLWDRSPDWARGKAKPGAIFILDHGQGRGHTGIVEAVGPLHLITIEGNTNELGSREGDGVYRRTRRMDEAVGYLDFSLPKPDAPTS
jgi:hypothetical protein